MRKYSLNPIISVISTLTIIILICIAALKWADYKNIYAVNAINIQGTNFFDKSIIEEKNQKIISNNILRSDLKKYKEEILELDHIKDCKISRQFPSTVNIVIYEREPIALINSDELIILDSEGVCLPVEYCDLSLPILSNFKTNPELYPKGFRTASNNVITSVKLMKYTKDNYSKIYKISEFVFNEDSEYEVILKNGKTRIMLGKNKLSTKIKYLNSFDQAFDGAKEITDYRYIDLRFNKQVIVKES
jgi:cell division septal protein FtsQ